MLGATLKAALLAGSLGFTSLLTSANFLSPAPRIETPEQPDAPAPELEPIEVETTGDYVIVEAAQASAFEPPAPRPLEFRAGAMVLVRGEATRMRLGWLTIDAGWMLIANLSGGRAVSGESLRQFVYLQVIIDLWSPWS